MDAQQLMLILILMELTVANSVKKETIQLHKMKLMMGLVMERIFIIKGCKKCSGLDIPC